MLQESGSTWDLRYIDREPSISMKIYLLFLLIVVVSTMVKLVKIWRMAPPFRLSSRAQNPAMLLRLTATADSLRQWIRLALVAWGLFTSITIYGFCNALLLSKGTFGVAVLFVTRDVSTFLTMTLLVILFSFLARWHILKRIEYVRCKVSSDS